MGTHCCKPINIYFREDRYTIDIKLEPFDPLFEQKKKFVGKAYPFNNITLIRKIDYS